MAFYKKQQQPVNKKWYPRSVLVSNPVTTDQIAKQLAAESTVAPADVKAVLEALSGVMGDYMAQGSSVKFDGIGSFYFTALANGNGVDTADEVNANLINGVKIRFVPETTYKRGGDTRSGRRAVRALTDVDIDWIDVATLGVQVSQVSETSGGNGGSNDDEPIIERP